MKRKKSLTGYVTINHWMKYFHFRQNSIGDIVIPDVFKSKNIIKSMYGSIEKYKILKLKITIEEI
jgi:hypothetical protein